MKDILAEISIKGSTLSPGQLARLCLDFDFNGEATHGEMLEFWRLAWGSFCNKKHITARGTQRSVAMYRVKSLLNLDRSKHFPHLDVKIVFYQVIIRLLSPQRVNQMDFGLCGPIHFTVMVLKSMPGKYVDFVADLLLKGCATGEDGTVLRPHEDVKSFDPGGSIPQADWLVAGSLRNLGGVPSGKSERGEYGGTRGPDVARFCVFFGFARYVQLTTYEDKIEFCLDKLVHKTIWTSSYEDYYPQNTRGMLDLFFNTKGMNLVDPGNSIRLAQALHRAGWGVLLKINAAWAATDENVDLQARMMKKYASNYEAFKLMYSGEELQTEWRKFLASKLQMEEQILKKEQRDVVETLGKPTTVFKILPVSSANHWVMVKSLDIVGEGEENIRLTIYTWGGKREPMVVPLAAFLKGYSGFVAAIAGSSVSMMSISGSASLTELSKVTPKTSIKGGGSSLAPVVSDPLLHPANRGRVTRVNPGQASDLNAILREDERRAQRELESRKQETSQQKGQESGQSGSSLKESGSSKKGSSLLGSHYYTEGEMYRLMRYYLTEDHDTLSAVPGVVVLHGIGGYDFPRLSPDAYRHSTHAEIDDVHTHTIIQPLNVHENHWGLLYIRLGPPGMGGVRPARVLYIDPLNPGDVPDLSPLRRAFPQLEVERSTIRYQNDGMIQHSCGAWVVLLALCLARYRDVVPPAEDDPRQAAVELRAMHQEVLEELDRD